MSVMTDARNLGEVWSRDELPTTGIPEPNEISSSLREINSVSRAFERRLGAVLAVNPTDLSAMEHLIQDGPLTPSDLAARLGVTTAASTLVVDRLAALGHVERHRHEHDRRKIVVVPTRASVNRAIDELMPVIMGVSRLVEELPESEREVIASFLTRVIDVYRTAVDAPLEGP
ncbi:MarR family winged helix-turn-helix transcriptional regulator [Herbiconiux ginsengi]|uniref:DNA-binding transcriptional regulator, MarR family n=1 Tax=Herbiconiux ginsengi TaxID=381665 RepID=A0A1H3M7W0_9MICO|nr:MarR family winged helix-turn-helix transcriptional regulator [Herbiconiux ginsengi]SDY72802.1 DNA-binding transcriptional regulator, MarR family [Herbiconiux ginsengi]